ncbi:hypothetical protein K9V48_27695, partial [Metabacillus sp. DBTR6]|nr:hypothetical protein [Metabacillus rhizolycopersici]MBZ5753876.1 hypothetical protein [Metabacillus rhizolycopersici]
MGILQELLKDIPLPKMAKVRQNFDDSKIEHLGEAIKEKLQRDAIEQKIKPGMEIAIAVGSRGLDRLPEITATTV